VTGSIVGGVFIAAAFSLVIGALVMVLWNWLMPAIFGLGVIGYWQGFGLVLMGKLIFGGMGHAGMYGKPYGPRGPHWCGGPGRSDGRDRRAEWKANWKRYGYGYGPNGHFDDVYEDWWEKEGSAGFEAFMSKKEADKAEKADAGKSE
jgi:hypothetical protein